MSITSPDDRLSEYNPVVPTTDFPATFPVFDNDDIRVFVDGVEREDFAISATYVEGISNNAKAVFAVGLTGLVQVVGDRDPRRTNRFGTGGPLPVRDQNLALDTIEAELQEAKRDSRRALKVGFDATEQDIPAPEDGRVLGWFGDTLVNLLLASVGYVAFGAKGIQVAAAATLNDVLTVLGFPSIQSNRMLVDNAAGNARESKSFGDVRILLDQSLSSGMTPASSTSVNAAALAAALSTSETTGLPVQPSFGTLPLAVGSVGTIPSGASIIGLGPYLTTFDREAPGPGLNAAGNSNVTLKGFTLDVNFATASMSGHGIRSQGGDNLLVEDVRILDFAWGGVDAGGGTGIIVTAPNDATRPQNPRIRNVHLEANPTSHEAFGWIYDRTDHGFATGIFSKGAVGNTVGTGMAHELKNGARHNMLSDLISEGSSIGLGLGQQTVGDFDGAAYNLIMGHLAHGCDVGYSMSKGQQNLAVGLMYVLDTGKPGSRTNFGLEFSTNSRSNAVFASLASGTVDAVANFKNGARYNYAQFYSTATGSVAKFETGTTRNVVDVAHPGATESSILALISDTSGSSTRGSAANVTYCMATGERVGSLSGTFHDRLEASGAAFNAAHYWRSEALTNVMHAMGHNGTTGNLAGISVGVPGDANRAAFQHQIGATAAADFWSLRGFGGGSRYSWEQNAYRPTTDNVVTNGSAATRWSVIYAGTGTINTSDANEKTKPLPIDDAVLDAWGDVRLICFQWLNAVAEKGADAARLHVGVIAQQVRDALEAHGIDGRRYGLLCHDKWDDMLEAVFEEIETEVTHNIEVARETGLLDHSGAPLTVIEIKSRTETVTKSVRVGDRVVTPAGERWGIREGQCLFVEAAYMRRRCERIEGRLLAIEGK